MKLVWLLLRVTRYLLVCGYQTLFIPILNCVSAYFSGGIPSFLHNASCELFNLTCVFLPALRCAGATGDDA